MKKKIIRLIVLGFASHLMAQSTQDTDAIKAMKGCYQVSFNFSETFSPKHNYQKKENYTSGALEWVEIVEEKPNTIRLQHILIVNPEGKGKEAIVKHWRQDWLYQNTDFLAFIKENHWAYQQRNPDEVKGQWSQMVYQVDDAPRYSGSGTWMHVDGRKFWESSTDAPLPRRESTTRKDYNVLHRNNKHEIFNWGWLHNQDNKKILRDGQNNDETIVEEKGLEYYKKIEDGKCLVAQNYWKEYATFWEIVRQTWDTELAKKKDLYLKPNEKDTYLYSKLIKLEPHQTKEAKQAVLDYILK